MDILGLAIGNLTKNRLSYLSEKQKVIAANVANANTPNYRAKDIKEPDFAAQLKKTSPAHMKMTVTNPMHMASSPVEGGMYQVYTPKPDMALTIDGNGVSLEDQLNEASKVKAEYDKALTIYNKYKSLLQTANTKIDT